MIGRAAGNLSQAQGIGAGGKGGPRYRLARDTNMVLLESMISLNNGSTTPSPLPSRINGEVGIRARGGRGKDAVTCRR